MAKKLIATHVNLPSISAWYSKIWDYVVMDKISDRILQAENPLKKKFIEKKMFLFIEKYVFWPG